MKTSKSTARKARYLGFKKYALIVLIFPIVLYGIAWLLVLIAANSSNIGFATALAIMIFAKYTFYVVYWIAALLGIAGLTYALIRRIKDWRYYVVAVILPLLVLGFYIQGQVRQYTFEHQPSYTRAQSVFDTCQLFEDHRVHSGDLITKYDYPKIKEYGMTEQAQAINARYQKMAEYADNIFIFGACNGVDVSEEQKAELLQKNEEYRAILADETEFKVAYKNGESKAILQQILALENQGKIDEAYQYGSGKQIAYSRFSIGRNCDANRLCVIVWIDVTRDTSITFSTQQVLDILSR